MVEPTCAQRILKPGFTRGLVQKKKHTVAKWLKDAKEQKTKQNTGWNYYLNYLTYYSINRK